VLDDPRLGPFKLQLLADEFVNHNSFTAAVAAWSLRLRQQMFNPLDVSFVSQV
jgi:hypothetical protein